jgi:2-polyprenyl-3-methyl-5-hydroxy-6-metoxy-1,4-benzoquinol methylase
MSRKPDRHAQFKSLTYDGFRELARDPSLSPYEKIGFPDSYREGKEQAIFEDLAAKIPALSRRESRILDIGAGCSDLPRILMRNAAALAQRLVFVDSAEMLALLPDEPVLEKIAGRFPACPELLNRDAGKFDGIIVYSVLQYVFVEDNAWSFLDAALSLLAPGGALLIGDIPNISKRRRFFASENGVRFHQQYTGRDERPEVHFNTVEAGEIDDSVVMSLIQRARAGGFDGYVVPQPPHLPMANRREDVLILRP